MSKIWFASDHHFGHANIIKYCNRPFANTDEMDQAMIDRHNAVVSAQDTVYFLGDFAFDRPTYYRVITKLNGKKRLILGNHDKLPASDYLVHFKKILGAFNYKTDLASYHFTHYPAVPVSFHPNGIFYNVHGHIHDKLVDDPRYINISVEHTNYGPVDLEWLDSEVAKREQR